MTGAPGRRSPRSGSQGPGRRRPGDQGPDQRGSAHPAAAHPAADDLEADDLEADDLEADDLEADDLVEVGRIARPHGLRGDVVVELTTDRDERVAPGSHLHSEAGPLVVVSSRPEHGQHGRRGSGVGVRAAHERWIVRFEGRSGREAVEDLRGLTLRAEPLDDPDELWAHDVVGAEVVLRASGERVGTCTAVVANPAADLLELDGGALVPVVFVTDHTPGRVVIDPPDGLLDL